MARKNYSWEKRQRELAKKKKQEDKRLKKAAAKEQQLSTQELPSESSS